MAEHLGPGLVTQGEAARTQERGAKIMIVGDSVSRSLGSGLEDWASDYGDVAVWSTGTNGCGIARGGELIAALGEKPETTNCDNWGERWAAQVDEFDPDLVVVLTGVWDLTDRRLPGSDAVTWVGDPNYDAYLVNEYAAAVDVLSARGAQVAWLTAPCVGPILPGPLSDNPALDAERTNYLNAAILPGLVAARPQVEVIDLFGHICPDGAYAGELGGIPHARPDGLHFSPASARWVADWLGLELLNRLPTDS
jgi:lysophospholipase L1-like esterase